MAKSRTRKSRRSSSSAGSPVPRFTRRRRSRGRSGGGGGMFKGLVPAGMVGAAVSTAAGFAGTALVLDRLPLPVSLQTGWGRIAAKVGVALIGAYALRRLAGPKIAAGFGVGGLTAAALDTFNRLRAPGAASGGSIAGLGDWEPQFVGVNRLGLPTGASAPAYAPDAYAYA